MTNRQAQTTPGRALWTLAKLVGGLAVFGATIWVVVVADGPADAGRAALFALLSKVLLDSGVADVLALGRAQQAEAAKAAGNTGVWKAHEAGTFTVRYEPDGGTWHVQGWVGPFTEYPSEIQWHDAGTLRHMIEEAEAEGMIPEDDPATRGIRARLMVAGWDSGHGAGIFPRDDS